MATSSFLSCGRLCRNSSILHPHSLSTLYKSGSPARFATTKLQQVPLELACFRFFSSSWLRRDSAVRVGSASGAYNPQVEVANVVCDPEAVKGSVSSSTAIPEFKYPVKRIRFRTCRDLYTAQFIFRRGNVPPMGIDVNVGYIDTGYPEPDVNSGPKERRKAFPTVLCIHGAAGTHKDFAGIINALADRGARVIAPNFPGFGPTPMDEEMIFKHTTIENCYFLLDFLGALKINRVDLVVAFSAGCYSAVPLSTKTGFPVRGLALLQIPGCRPYRAVKPFWILKTVVRIMGRSWIRKLLNPISYCIMKVTGWKHIPSIDTPYIMGLVTTGVPFESYRLVSSELPFRRLPLLLTFSEDDKYMDAHISYEYADIVGLPKERLTIVDESGAIHRRGAPIMEADTYLKGLVFQKGGHYAQRRDPTKSIVESSVVEIYDHICRTNALIREETIKLTAPGDYYKGLKS